jgi:hypothetical protein
MKTEKPFVFSSLFAEDEAYLQAYLDNFTLFAKPEDYLIINSTVKLDASKYKQFTQVHFIYHDKPRAKWGATLLESHVENYQYAKKLLGPDTFVFITTASNALFFRTYDKQAILAKLEIHFEKLGDLDNHHGWIFEHIKRNKNITDLLGRKYTWSQIEGFTTFSENWQLIEDLIDKLAKIAENPPLDDLPPYEEFVPLTVLLKENRTFTHLCHMLWAQSREGDYNVGLNEIFNPPPEVENHIAMYKWFPRTTKDITTKAVCDIEMYRSLERVYQFTSQNNSNLNNFELGSSFLKNIPQFAAASAEPYQFNKPITHAMNRKVINFSDHDSKSPYVFFEFLSEDIKGNLAVNISGDRVQINSDITQGGSTNRIYYDYKFYCILYIPLADSRAKEVMLRYHDAPLMNFESGQLGPAHEKIHNTSQILNFSYCTDKYFYEKSINHASSYKNNLLKPVQIFEMLGQHNLNQKFIGIPIMNKLNLNFSILTFK